MAMASRWNNAATSARGGKLGLWWHQKGNMPLSFHVLPRENGRAQHRRPVAMPSSSSTTMSDDLRSGALVYHRLPKPGKLEIQPTKPLANQRDLALAYSPGVAAACEAIHADPAEAANLTARGNLVAVISNGTAVLGLGDIGPLASKPVMEGKAVPFKKFAGIDVFDIEISPRTVEEI